VDSRATLHFVYNVDGTPKAMVLDFLHRMNYPDNYPCRLCDITYGRFMKKAEWSRFVSRLGIRSRFHVRNTFIRRFPTQASEPLPAVLVEEPGGEFRTLISADDLQSISDLDDLTELVTKRVAELGTSSASN
jgi:hypothetical protein